MSGADKYLAYLNAVANNPDARDEYVWGAAGGVDRDHDGFKEADCSGLRHAALTAAGIADVRTTADGYMRRAWRIPAPSQIGDFAVLLNASGVAHHIIQYVGDGKTIEARGKAYGIVRDTVRGVNVRGGKWCRQAVINAALGTVTPPKPIVRTGVVIGRDPAPLLAAPKRSREVFELQVGWTVRILADNGAYYNVRRGPIGSHGVAGYVLKSYIQETTPTKE